MVKSGRLCNLEHHYNFTVQITCSSPLLSHKKPNHWGWTANNGKNFQALVSPLYDWVCMISSQTPSPDIHSHPLPLSCCRTTVLASPPTWSTVVESFPLSIPKRSPQNPTNDTVREWRMSPRGQLRMRMRMIKVDVGHLGLYPTVRIGDWNNWVLRTRDLVADYYELPFYIIYVKEANLFSRRLVT